MTEILVVFQNRILWVAVISWVVAQMIKFSLVAITSRKFSPSRLIGSGGMPSAHSAFVTSLGMAVGFHEGFDSAFFALAFAFAVVVMYDAAGVRQAAGKQAKAINKILADMLENGKWVTNEQLKELIGHTPVEVVAGALLGALIAVLAA